ncbi:tripartite tricarboxylate transporter substrate-binding protein [Comamonas aquatica]|nr:tripartite tricarboxylate transporter substrate-binding protein [Comamonas aquatica]MDH1675848.1 tripartite tricarboxylate transporter substrate-binding protein [Comamonas aquatica]MDH1679510.1 tripartite tricarboxylate transporter substrate-binding protein [Comamonas aquatica]
MLLTAGAVWAGLVANAAMAAEYPSKPIKLIVPFAAGGSTDIVARVIAEAMRHALGQPVVVDNRGGAGGLIGTEAIASAPADGYTIGMATVSTLTVNPLLYQRAANLSPKLLPVVNLVTMPAVLMVHPNVSANSLAEIVALEKVKPGSISGGVPGHGTLGHLLMASMNDTLHTSIQIVPYRGNGPALNDTLAGSVQMLVDQLPSSLSLVKANKLKPLVIAAAERSPEMPQVPTFKELGYTQLNDLGISWFGLVVPSNTPKAIVDKIASAAAQAVRRPEVQQQLAKLGAAPTDLGNTTFSAQIAQQLQRNKQLLDKAGVKVE